MIRHLQLFKFSDLYTKSTNHPIEMIKEYDVSTVARY